MSLVKRAALVAALLFAPHARADLAAGAIQRVVVMHRAEVRACYEAGLKKNPDLAGKVVVAWVIAPGGAVSSARIASSTLANANVEACIVSRVQTWRFPAPGSPTDVTYPFVFAAG